MTEHFFLVPLLPLAASGLIFFFGHRLGLKGAWLGLAAAAAGFLLSIDWLLKFLDGTLQIPLERSVTWFEIGVFRSEWGVLLDGTSLVMLSVVTGVSFLVQFYSLGYMKEAPRFQQYFAYLSLFTAAMLALVMANNYLQFFVGWELMGVCSYLLIGFEFERDAAAAAGNKAFITTRVGDIGFYAALLVIFFFLGTFNFTQIQNHIADSQVTVPVCGAIALLLFCGAAGKSAQMPLHVWLPDAMEGPTPVSALIHAATMVAAGIYLVARSYAFFVAAPQALSVVAWVGGLTAFFAATIALTANDVKKVLAYSTISQLGTMMMGLGVLGYSAGLFHLTTHAAFKALLFLAAGSLIHAAHTNDLWKMGSLSKQMPTTMVTFACGMLALVGFPGTSGFFSKESILEMAFHHHHYLLFALGCVTAFLTSFYMARAFCLAFLGQPRERDRFAHAHESPWSMTVPLIILSVPSILLGWILKNHVRQFFPYPGMDDAAASHAATAMAVGAGLTGLFFGFLLYSGHFSGAVRLAKAASPLYRLLSRRYYVDELYDRLLVVPIRWIARAMDAFDARVIDRLFVDGVGRLALHAAPRTGAQAQRYLLVIAFGFIFLLVSLDYLTR